MKNLLPSGGKYGVLLGVIRVLVGAIIVSFGLEMLSPEKMTGYTQWLGEVGMPLPAPMAYLGKLAEVVFGTLLLLGLFTRISTIPLIVTMLVVNFIMLEGDLRSEPFYLLLLFACFLCTEGGPLSADSLLRKRALHPR